MKATTQSNPEQFPPLEQINRPTVDTTQAAFYFNRQPQTLRLWASRDGSGPIRPVRCNGRLAWKVADIKAALEVA